jgi:hypothetical protein
LSHPTAITIVVDRSCHYDARVFLKCKDVFFSRKKHNNKKNQNYQFILPTTSPDSIKFSALEGADDIPI